MRVAMLAIVAAVVAFAATRPALAQVPIPVQEQVELFNSMSPAQQQALIRELQGSLPPAQRQAIIELLQQGGGVGQSTDPNSQQQAAPGSIPLESEEEPWQGFLGRFTAGDTLVIEFAPGADAAVGLSPAAELQVEEFRQRLADGNPYQLDGSGQLYLPGVRTIALAGLSAEEATVRIRTEPALRPFEIMLTPLPLEPVGISALQPFGYDLFRDAQGTFAPFMEIPVPVGYVVGPGDTVNVQLFGNQNAEYFLTVSREGTINFPQIGPINVSGLTFADMRDVLNQRVAEQMIGVRASITLGELRSIRVFVLGDVEQPGSYAVSSLATMTNALLASGGVRAIGSLRNVQLRRDGELIETLDLYDLLLRGDTQNDARLQPGDAIFVPPVGETVSIDGEVRRPAIYELRNERSIAELVSLAGGMRPMANRAAVKLERIVPGLGTSVRDISLLTSAGGQTLVEDGDVIRVLPNLSQLAGSVRLAGNVYQPGLSQWSTGMRLSDLLPSPEWVKPMSDLNYVLIRREVAPNVEIEVLSADLEGIWQQEPGARDVFLEARDTAHVFNLETGRQHIVQPILEELQAQAPPNQPFPVVRIGGQVRAVGEYPLEPGMRLSDLLRAGGGLSESAYAIDAELTRYAIVNDEYRETELMQVNLAALTRGDLGADFMLAPYDYLSIREVPRWRQQQAVTVRGEVVFPGEYQIRQGETLSSVLQRAGGFTELAFPEGSVFIREELRERERAQVETLARRVENDLAALSLSDPNSSEAISVGQTLVTQLRTAQASGRLVIRLDDLIAGDLNGDILLKDGDQLLVPDVSQEVTVLGEVQYATSHVYTTGRTRDDYLSMSGGLTQRADDDRVYVVRANGEVLAETGSKWFRRTSEVEIRPGDTIVAPLDVDRLSPMARWSQITQIVYNLAIAAAAVNSF
jgi:protein involved in polysaccharide export with SLBB domain